MDENKKKKKEIKVENVWTDECEELLAEWSEKASCYRWLHGRSEKNYRKWYYCFSIPVIVLSTLTGAANVGMDSFVPAESKSMASAIVGGVNIFAGIVSTLQNFLKVAELMEAHRIAGVSWGKLQRNIAIELALDPSRRVIQSDFLKMSRSEYDRLLEAGPIIDDGVIAQFNKKFKNYEVAVPSICNGLDKCNIYKIDTSIKMNPDDFIDGIEDIVSKEEKPVSPLNIVKVGPGSSYSESTVSDLSPTIPKFQKVSKGTIESVGESVGESIEESIGESVGESVGESIEESIEESIVPKTEEKKCTCNEELKQLEQDEQPEELKQPEQVEQPEELKQPEESFNSVDSINDDSSEDSTDEFLSKITEDK